MTTQEIKKVKLFVYLIHAITDVRHREKGNATNENSHSSTDVRCFLLLYISYFQINFFFPFCKDVSYQFIEPWY